MRGKVSDRERNRRGLATHHDAVIPSKNGKFIQSCNKVPSGSYVAGDEDAEGEDREWVHQSRLIESTYFEVFVESSRDTFRTIRECRKEAERC